MGNHLTSQNVHLHDCLHELSNYTFESSMGKGRFLKTIRFLSDEGTVLVKIYIKPTNQNITLANYEQKLKEIRDRFSTLNKSNVLPFRQFFETEKAAYLIRQFIQNNLYDRINTRPFLTTIEKKWITYQLISAVEEGHIFGICHGDIKCENVLITSWNWIYLSDFAPYKPTYIPNDNPADFSYYFDSSGRRTCYIAPERFVSSGVQSQKKNDELQPSMDIFSLGCTIAEFWLEDGNSLFDYSELLAYCKNENDPTVKINKIKDKDIRNLVLHMIQRDPTKRSSASAYLKEWCAKIFPSYFEFLHEYISSLMEMEPDNIVIKIYNDFDMLMEKFNPSLAAKLKRFSFRLPTKLSEDVVESGEAAKATKGDGLGDEQSSMKLLVEIQKLIHDLELEKKDDSVSVPIMDKEDEFLMGDDDESEFSGTSYERKFLSATTTTAAAAASPSSATTATRATEETETTEYEIRRSIKFNKRRLMTAKKTGEKTVQLQSYFNLGIAFHSIGDKEKAKKCFMKGLELTKQLDDKFYYIKLCCSLGDLYRDQKEMTCAFQYYETALELSKELGDKELQSQVLGALEYACRIVNDFEKAIKFQKELIEVLKDLGDFGGPKRRRSIDKQAATAVSVLEEVHVEGFVIILCLLCSMVRSLRTREARLMCLATMDKISNYMTDEVRLERLIPYYMTLLQPGDSSALVRAQTIKYITRTLWMINSFPPSESHIFSEYLLSTFSRFINEEPEELVKQAYAECLPKLAYTARRCLEHFHFLKQKQLKESSGVVDSREHSNINFQKELDELMTTFKDMIEVMLSKDSPKSVKKALLSDVSTLCMFFGQEKTNDILLPLITSCLDHRNWDLKGVFFENVVGICNVAGPNAIEYILPSLILPEIYGDEEIVVEKTLNCLASLVDLGIFGKQKLLRICQTAAPLLLHPNTWIRFGVIALMVSTANKLGLADIHCFLIPILRPYLVRDIIEVTKLSLLESLRTPLSRRSFEKAVNISYVDVSAFTNEPDMFFVEQKDPNIIAIKRNEQGEIIRSAELTRIHIGKQRKEEMEVEKAKIMDVSFSLKIASLDLPSEDEDKLFLMKEYLKEASAAYRRRKVDVNTSQIMSGPPIKNPSPILYSLEVNKKELFETTDTNLLNERDSVGTTQSNKYLFDSLSEKNERGKRRIAQPTDSATTSVSATSRFYSSSISVIPSSPRSVNSPLLLPQSSPATFLLPPPTPNLGTLLLTRTPLTQTSFKEWNPKGILVAHLHEHKEAVNCLAVSNDSMFFVSGSDDGDVKIWDCQRLEKNIANRSRLTYSSQGGRIKSVCICENSHSVASASSNGSIHIFRVECGQKREKPSNLLEYSNLSTVKNLDKLEGSIIKIDHYETNTQSLIVYVTDKGRIHGWDLRAEREAWVMQNPLHFGLVTDMVIDPHRMWLAVGTNRGLLTQWDIRFQVPLQHWRIPGKFGEPVVYKLQTYVDEVTVLAASGVSAINVKNLTRAMSSLSSSSSSFASSSPIIKESDKNMGDSKKTECHQDVVSPSHPSHPPPLLSSSTTNSNKSFNNDTQNLIEMREPSFEPPDITAFNLQNSKYMFFLRIQNSEKSSPLPPLKDQNDLMGDSLLSNLDLLQVSAMEEGLYLEQWSSDVRKKSSSPSSILPPLSSSSSSSSPLSSSSSVRALLCPPNSAAIISGGIDGRLRYWDMNKPQTSYIISGLQQNELKPKYKGYKHDDVLVVEEYPDFHSNRKSEIEMARTTSTVLGLSGTVHHCDTILDIKCLDFSQKMLVSCSRDGVIKVWK